MGSDYQTRKDIDRLIRFLDSLEYELTQKYNVSDLPSLMARFYDTSEIDTMILRKLGLDQPSSEKFNYAVINKTKDDVSYEEFWILSNAYYDYSLNRFVKMDINSNSFGIQIQATGTYPGEQELGYADNTSIGIWRNPKSSDVYKDTINYDYTDFDNLHHIGAKLKNNNEWVEFGISAGWSNNFMIDSYGGMTIGGAGFEIDGNGIFPYTRLTSSRYFDGTNNIYLLGVLDNAYHPTIYDWDCDNNSTYSWFFGLKYPEYSALVKDNKEASFVVMYNDTSYDSEDIHNLDISKWHTVFETKISDASDYTNGGWSDLTLTSNFYNFDTANKVKYRRINKTVQITGLAVLNAYPSALTELVIGSLPTDCKPNRDVSCLCELHNDAKLWTCTIKSNGDLTFNRLRDSTGFVGGTAFSDILKVNITYLV